LKNPVQKATKLALDATEAAQPERTGIGIYSEKLIFHLAHLLITEPSRPFRAVLAFRPGPFWRYAWDHTWPMPFSISPLLDPWLRFPRAELFHGLNQWLPERRYPVQVVTLHERYPSPSTSYSTPDFQRYMAERIEKATRSADWIIAVSDSVRQQLLAHDPTLENKIRVIHHGVDPPRLAAQDEMDSFRKSVLGFVDGERFFLNVGAIQTRKNIASIALALRQVPGFKLVLAGGDGYGAEEIRALIRKEGLENRVCFLGHTRPEVLRLLYSTATALVFPSFEEAFGMPILEAMGYGLPVITSDTSAMPEIGGNAALYVDPNNISYIRDAMLLVAEDDTLARDLGRRGRQRAGEFRWEDCASQTWNLYQEALQERI
jgi:glycosyltransferase involved in cell wall biosynthesis